jgi:hypothetical protein
MYQFAKIATLNSGSGLSLGRSKQSNPEQAKDFLRESVSSKNPKIGRNALIFWICLLLLCHDDYPQAIQRKDS